LNNNTLKGLLKIKKMTIKELAEDHLDMSEGGFHEALKNNTLQVKKLEKIAEVLGVPIEVFFREGGDINSYVNEGQAIYNNLHTNKGDMNQSFGSSKKDKDCWEKLKQKEEELALAKKYITLLENTRNP
jgi:transcriptional regulator with XRE-family HTH domain